VRGRRRGRIGERRARGEEGTGWCWAGKGKCWPWGLFEFRRSLAQITSLSMLNLCSHSVNTARGLFSGMGMRVIRHFCNLWASGGGKRERGVCVKR